MVGFVVPLQGVVLLPEAAGGAEDVSLNVDLLAGYACGFRGISGAVKSGECCLMERGPAIGGVPLGERLLAGAKLTGKDTVGSLQTWQRFHHSGCALS